jgi:Ca-activated chloride channel family protein
MRFANPQMLWLLLAALPLLTWFLWWAWRRKQSLVSQFVQSRLLAQLTVGVSQLRQKVRLALLVSAVGCVILALARPQWGYDSETARRRGLDIVVAIDTSRSMLAEDVRPNRLARAKLAALDLMRLAKSDRLGLVAFAGDAFLQCPLTLDEDAFRQSVTALEVGIIPQGGSLLTEAIETALGAFKSDSENYKTLVLFSDGEDHDSGAVEAAEKAAKAGLKIFTVGVGTPNGELLRVTDENGVASYIKDAQGNAVKSRLNEKLLRQIATAAGGSYLPLRAANAIETLYTEGLAPLPKAEVSTRLVKRYHERFQWPLGLAILLLLTEMFWPERRRVPRSETLVNAANAGLRKAVAALLLLTIPGAVFASSSGAKRLYESGKYKEAQQEYERLLEKSRDSGSKQPEDVLGMLAAGKDAEAEAALSRMLEKEKADPGDPRLHFNAGAAAYKAGDLENAMQHFAQASTSPDVDLQQRVFYNLGNTLYRLGEQKQEANEKIQQWETALQGYDAALKLNTNDFDAEYNRNFVKEKLEELRKQQAKQQQDKKQQQQQKKDNQAKQDSQKQKDQNDQKRQPDSSKQEKQQQQAKSDSQPQDQKNQQKEKQQESAANQKQKEEQQANQNKPQAGGKGDEKSGEQTQATTSQVSPGKMTQQQAQQLLDSLKGEEQAWIFVPAKKAEPRNRVFKDW